METPESFKELKNELMLYLESRIELFRLEAIDHSSYLLSLFLGLFILITVALTFLLSLGLFMGFWLGELLDSNWAGFAIMSGFFLLMVLIIIARFKTMIQIPVQNYLIRMIDNYNEKESE